MRAKKQTDLKPGFIEGFERSTGRIVTKVYDGGNRWLVATRPQTPGLNCDPYYIVFKDNNTYIGLGRLMFSDFYKNAIKHPVYEREEDDDYDPDICGFWGCLSKEVEDRIGSDICQICDLVLRIDDWDVKDSELILTCSVIKGDVGGIDKAIVMDMDGQLCGERPVRYIETIKRGKRTKHLIAIDKNDSNMEVFLLKTSDDNKAKLSQLSIRYMMENKY